MALTTHPFDTATGKWMSRLAPVDPATLEARAKALYDGYLNGPHKGVRPPGAFFLYRPDIAEPAQTLAKFCRWGTCLSPRLSELAILMLGKHWHAEYEWAAHKPLALKDGVAPEIVEAIRTGAQPEFTEPDEALVYDFVNSLTKDLELSEELYERALSILGRDGVIDLTTITGYYSLVSMTLKVFGIVRRPGEADDLPPK